MSRRSKNPTYRLHKQSGQDILSGALPKGLLSRNDLERWLRDAEEHDPRPN